MRIAYVADAQLPSQAANAVQVFHMAAAMGRLGHEVHLLAPWHARRVRSPTEMARLRRQYALSGDFRLEYLPYFAVGERLRASYFLISVLAAARRRADLVFTRNLRIARLAARLGARVVLESHAPPNSAASRAAARSLAESPGLVRWVFISDRLRQIYGAEVDLPLEDHRCVVAHDGVDLARFSPMTTAREARAWLGLDAERPLVVHSGHLYRGRGAELLVGVARALPEVDFLFVGGTDADLIRVREAASDAENVRLTGHRPLGELPSYLFAADVLCMPHTSKLLISDGRTSTSEYASPMKLFEYMAAGRAIVATRFPSVTEVITDGMNGILVEPDRVEPLRDAIAALIDEPARARELGARARGDAEGHTWEARAQRILAGL